MSCRCAFALLHAAILCASVRGVNQPDVLSISFSNCGGRPERAQKTLAFAAWRGARRADTSVLGLEYDRHASVTLPGALRPIERETERMQFQTVRDGRSIAPTAKLLGASPRCQVSHMVV